MSRVQKRRRFELVKALNVPVKSLLKQGSEVSQIRLASSLVSSGQGLVETDSMLRSSNRVVSTVHEFNSMSWDLTFSSKSLAGAYDLCVLPKNIDPDKGLIPKGRAKGAIKFEDVRFSYPHKGVETLKGVNLEISPGQTLGMTGKTGCGKSTALRLLERFYDVTGGRILLDGVDIREYNPRWLRAQFATVSQEPKLLRTTIRENLAFGCSKEPTLAEIHNACKAANIYDQLMDREKFPSGLRTKLESVQTISGGRSSLALLWTLACGRNRETTSCHCTGDPPILLLDEATSALDKEAQEQVQGALNELMKGRTTLVIAHRFSTIRDSDAIAAFENGVVVECDSRDTLIKKGKSVYAKLWRKQSGVSNGDDSGEDEEDQDATVSTSEGSEDDYWSMNPPPSAETRLMKLEQRVKQLDVDPSIKVELHSIIKSLTTESSNQVPKDAREMYLKGSSVVTWMSHMIDWTDETYMDERIESKKSLRGVARGVMSRCRRLLEGCPKSWRRWV